jgi:hypothetical protein
LVKGTIEGRLWQAQCLNLSLLSFFQTHGYKGLLGGIPENSFQVVQSVEDVSLPPFYGKDSKLFRSGGSVQRLLGSVGNRTRSLGKDIVPIHSSLESTGTFIT